MMGGGVEARLWKGTRARVCFGFLSKLSMGAAIYRVRLDLDVRVAESNSYPR
jgi:hypothetical protein